MIGTITTGPDADIVRIRSIDMGKLGKITIALGGTINLGDYENVKVEVAAEVDGKEQARELMLALDDILSDIGKTDEHVEARISSFRNRVFGQLHAVEPEKKPLAKKAKEPEPLKEEISGETKTKAKEAGFEFPEDKPKPEKPAEGYEVDVACKKCGKKPVFVRNSGEERVLRMYGPCPECMKEAQAAQRAKAAAKT